MAPIQVFGYVHVGYNERPTRPQHSERFLEGLFLEIQGNVVKKETRYDSIERLVGKG